MEKDNKGVSLDEFIFRKLQPLRILRGYLANEVELSEGEDVRISRTDLDNMLGTLEIFLEEYDRVSAFRGRKGGVDRKKSFIDAKPQAIKAIA